MIHIFLCDDDSRYLEYLSEIVDSFFRQNNIEAGIKTFTDGEKLLEEPEMADIVFLDVEMPGKSGIEVGRSIKEKNPYALIFIVSFTEQYLDDAMDFQVFRYIEKASLPDRIERNLRDALMAYRNTNPKITIMQNGETIVCWEADIVMIENQRRCVYVCTKDAIAYNIPGNVWSLEHGVTVEPPAVSYNGADVKDSVTMAFGVEITAPPDWKEQEEIQDVNSYEAYEKVVVVAGVAYVIYRVGRVVVATCVGGPVLGGVATVAP